MVLILQRGTKVTDGGLRQLFEDPEVRRIVRDEELYRERDDDGTMLLTPKEQQESKEHRETIVLLEAVVKELDDRLWWFTHTYAAEDIKTDFRKRLGFQ